MTTQEQLDEQFINGQISDAKGQIQIALTSIFMAENTLRKIGSPHRANILFELRKQISKQVLQALGETPCIQPHNRIL